MDKEVKIAVVGLGYVGLPLAVCLGKYYTVLGYDINPTRIAALNNGVDHTHELNADDIHSATRLSFSHVPEDMQDCNVFIVTVPTPLNEDKTPDLRFLLAASKTVGQYLKKGDTVIYESTVYPGCTEDDCVPVLVAQSGFVYNQDFFVGYSPERINPGDKTRRIEQITKVVSGSTPEAALFIQGLYDKAIAAGTYLAPSIKVAEAAKAIENAQRDVNISFMNELALMFDRMGINTGDVLAAAATKWNFLPFRPGLVGGHCIGVDPHYLVFQAKRMGYEPRVIAAGRDINEHMAAHVIQKIVTTLAKKHQGQLHGLNVVILGYSFKENCADTRNTKVKELYTGLKEAGMQVRVQDPLVSKGNGDHPHAIDWCEEIQQDTQVLILAVAHDAFLQLPFEQYHHQGKFICDLTFKLPKHLVDLSL